MKIFKLLTGYKTYIASIMIMVAGVGMMISGDLSGGLMHIVGNDEFMRGLITFLEGVGLGALRSGVTSAGKEIRNYLDYQSIALPSFDEVEGENEKAIKK